MLRVACCTLRVARCALRVACCVLRVACCALLVACCNAVLHCAAVQVVSRRRLLLTGYPMHNRPSAGRPALGAARRSVPGVPRRPVGYPARGCLRSPAPHGWRTVSTVSTVGLHARAAGVGPRCTRCNVQPPTCNTACNVLQVQHATRSMHGTRTPPRSAGRSCMRWCGSSRRAAVRSTATRSGPSSSGRSLTASPAPPLLPQFPPQFGPWAARSASVVVLSAPAQVCRLVARARKRIEARPCRVGRARTPLRCRWTRLNARLVGIAGWSGLRPVWR
jgi:hypothetical protein